MAKKTRNEMRLRRHRRVRVNVAGTPERPRLNVFRSLNHIYAQLIDDLNERTIASTSTLDNEIRTDLKGKNKTEQARLVGTRIAEIAKAEGVKQVIFDRGGYRYHGRVASLAEGAREAGLDF